MKILVAVKQVAARDALLWLADSGLWVDENDVGWETNEPDAYALEEALQLKEQQGGEVVVVTAGPERVTPTIREALAKGADRAIHVDVEGLETWDALGVARLLKAVCDTEKPDLVLTGLQSDDACSGQTGVALAELLGVAHATIVMAVEASGGGVRVKRELEGGWFQHVELPLPAVLTIQSGISKLRYATLMGIKKAKTKEVKRVTSAELGVEPAAGLRLLRLAKPAHSKQTQFLSGSPAAQAAALVEKLRTEARVL